LGLDKVCISASVSFFVFTMFNWHLQKVFNLLSSSLRSVLSWISFLHLAINSSSNPSACSSIVLPELVKHCCIALFRVLSVSTNPLISIMPPFDPVVNCLYCFFVKCQSSLLIWHS